MDEESPMIKAKGLEEFELFLGVLGGSLAEDAAGDGLATEPSGFDTGTEAAVAGIAETRGAVEETILPECFRHERVAPPVRNDLEWVGHGEAEKLTESPAEGFGDLAEIIVEMHLRPRGRSVNDPVGFWTTTGLRFIADGP